MAVRKSMNPELISSLISGAANQVISTSTPKTDDPNFPVFRTPLEKDLIVYFPKVCVQTVDGQEIYNPLVAHAHSLRKGKQYLTYRCISGLAGGVYDQLGYDGSCPFCEGMANCWDLYNEKMARKAAELGVDLQNDVADTMKPYIQQFVGEMAIKKSDEYVTFPIVIITDTGVIPQNPADVKLEVQYVQMRKDTFVDKIMDPLTKQATPIPHPGGMFFKWVFTYDTKGKQANVRDAAKNAKYLPIVDAASTQALSQYIAAAEEKAAPFTNTQAATVLVMNEFFDKDFLVQECDAVLAETNRTLSVLKGAGAATPAATALPSGMGAGVAGALAQFGGAPATTDAAPAQISSVPTQGTVAPVQPEAAPAATAQGTATFAGFGQ